MWSSILLVGVCLAYTVQSLGPFDPWASGNDICKPSMNACTYSLHANSAMTMFFRQLFRVVATDEGILHKYDEPDDKFPLEDVLTADGYPKLVSFAYSIEDECKRI